MRELLFNVVKHAGVEQARVWVTEAGAEFMVCVEDEGVGFDVEAAPEAEIRPGLLDLRQRLDYFGGRLEIYSTPGEGTYARIFIPGRWFAD